jgi:hypothetical protein
VVRALAATFTVLAIIVILFNGKPAWAATAVVPSTTLALETGNNTSTANSFGGQSNGNPGPGNVSKVDTHSLLYAGATTKIYAHVMPWWGSSSHTDIGYNSNDP